MCNHSYSTLYDFSHKVKWLGYISPHVPEILASRWQRRGGKECREEEDTGSDRKRKGGVAMIGEEVWKIGGRKSEREGKRRGEKAGRRGSQEMREGEKRQEEEGRREGKVRRK